jgi:hypothetical protein
MGANAFVTDDTKDNIALVLGLLGMIAAVTLMALSIEWIW